MKNEILAIILACGLSYGFGFALGKLSVYLNPSIVPGICEIPR